jgi:type VI secretion system protein ImpG
LDFEVYALTSVVGHGIGSDSEQRFEPFYAAFTGDATQPASAYFTTRREPRMLSATAKRRGPRSSYIGTEVFLGLVDAAQAPFSGNLRQLSIETLCTNRDLPLQLSPTAAGSQLTLDVAAPVNATRIVAGPSRPHAPLADGAIAWRAISHLSQNYLSFSPTWDGKHWQTATGQEAAAGLREILELYVPVADVAGRRQIEGIRAVTVDRIVRRVPGPGPLAFGRGLEIAVAVDELAFEGASAFLLGAVLNRYFARHVSINSFIEMVLRNDRREEISRWGHQWGARPTL